MSEIDRAVERLSRELNSLRRQVRAQGRASQAAFRSVETTDGSVEYYDADGNAVLTIGETVDGSYTIQENALEPPPVPSAPDVQERPGAIAVLFDGTFADGATPDDLAYFEIHRSQTPGFFADDTTQVGTFASPQGGTYVMPAEYAEGSYYFAIQAVNRSGLESDKSDEVSGRGASYPAAAITTAPGTSPAVTLSGNATTLVGRAENVAVGTSIEYYISETDGFIPGPTNLFATTQATVVVFDKLPGTTTQLLPNKPYFVVARAVNVIGASPTFSPQVSAKLDPSVLASYTITELVAGFILAGKIQVGQAYIDANEGIVIPQPDGGTISFPVNGDFAQITAKLIARSLNVTDNLTINGSNNQVFGQVTLGEGIVKPQVPPQLSSVNKQYHALDVFGPNVQQGLMEDPANAANWLLVGAFFGTFVKSITKAGFTWNGDLTVAGIPAAISDFQPFGGMVYSPGAGRYIMLGTASNSAGTGVAWWFVSFSRTGTTLNYSSRLEITAVTSFPYQPRMAWDTAGNQGYLFYMNENADNRLRYITFQVASGSVTRDPGTTWSTTAMVTKYNIGGAYIGNADFGAKRFVVVPKGGVCTVWSGTPGSATSQPNDAFVRPATTMDIFWDGTRFWTLSDNGDLYKHSTNKAPAGRTTLPIQARHTWWDNAGTTHETDGGPIETHSLGARQWLRIETDPAPDTDGDPLDLEKADTIRMYVSNDGVTLPRVQTADGWSPMSSGTVLRKKIRNVNTASAVIGDNFVLAYPLESFVQDDIGGTITGTGIPAGTTITGVDINGIKATLSNTITVTGAPVVTVTPVVSTRVGLFESINNANTAAPTINGFAAVNRAPGAYKSTRTDVNGPLIILKGDGSGRIGPWQFDNSGKTLNDFGPERPGTLIWWPSPNVPLDCAACQGQAVKRPAGIAGGNGAAANPLAVNTASDVAPFIRVWQLFGTLFGAGDGSTTFNLPDAQRRILFDAGNLTVGRNEGISTANMTTRTFAHLHNIPAHGHADTFALNKNQDAKPVGTGGGQVLLGTSSLSGAVTNKAAFDTSNSAFDDLPNLAVRVIIKL